MDRKDFQYVEMDTDSAYMAISAPLEDIIRPELREEFYQNYNLWFPRQACPSHRDTFVKHKLENKGWDVKERDCCLKTFLYDRRTPSLFKEEFSGDGIVALNSKTYYCWSGEEGQKKYSSKGLSKNTNALTKDHYLSVLRSTRPFLGVNKGFVKKRGRIRTYNQLKTGLTYFYAKRQVADDGVTTSNVEA